MISSLEQYWRARAESLLLSDIRTELYEDLREMLACRDLGPSARVEQWLETVEAEFLRQYEQSEESQSPSHELVTLAELFSSEGVEAWLEAFELFREGASAERVLEVAETGQRYLWVVRDIAQDFQDTGS